LGIGHWALGIGHSESKRYRRMWRNIRGDSFLVPRGD
jgi:hypothetical protein